MAVVAWVAVVAHSKRKTDGHASEDPDADLCIWTTDELAVTMEKKGF
jgi:hypothetical protein